MPPKKFNAFISYSHADGEDLAHKLQQKINDDARGREITFWQDRSQMKYGQWSRQIEEAIDGVEFLIMLITSGALVSPNCKDEWMYARKQGVSVLPVNGKPDDPEFYRNFPNWLKKQHIYDPKKNWERFINDLNSRPETPKVPFMAPRLSSVYNYVARSAKLSRLKDLLLHEDKHVAITTALQGSGGFGKTTLAIALCNEDDIINAFEDGILWVTLGQQKGSALRAMEKLYDSISNDHRNFIDTEQGQQVLSDKLANRNCLLVLDDVWYTMDAENILNAAGKSTVLITTRMNNLLLNVKQVVVDEMTRTEAIKHLVNFIKDQDMLNDKIGDLAEKLGYWPLLLKLVGAQLKARIDGGDREELAIDFINRKLERRGLIAFDRLNAEQRNDSVKICLSASIDLLEDDEKEKLYTLGIFPEDESIPYQVLEKYWNMNDLDCEEFLHKLQCYALIDTDILSKTIKMHDILLRYYGTCLKTKDAQHLRLMDSVGSFETWNDKYLWIWAIWHMAKAGRNEDALKLLTNYDWIERKLIATDNIYTVTDDYLHIPISEDMHLIRKALLLGAVFINNDRKQLAHQLFGRLNLLDSMICKNLAQQALDNILKEKFSLQPLYANLEMPHQDQLVFKGHNSSVDGAIWPNNLLISWSVDKTLRSWDLSSGKTMNVFIGHSSKIRGAFAKGNTLITWSDDKTIRSWDLSLGEIKQVYEGHPFKTLMDGNTLVSWTDKSIHIWDLQLGEVKHICQDFSFRINGMLLKGDKLISWSNDMCLRSWSLTSSKIKQIFDSHSSNINGALLHDNMLISWSADNTLRSWDLVSGELKNVFKKHTASVTGAIMYGDTLISCSDDEKIRSWDIFSGRAKELFWGHRGRIQGMIIHDQTLISWSDDNTLHTWDIQKGTFKQIFEVRSSIMGAAAKINTLISWCNDSTLWLWDIRSGKVKKIFESVKGHLVHGDTLITWSNDNSLHSWDIHTAGKKDVFRGHVSKINGALAYDNTLISWSDDKTMRLWDITSKKTYDSSSNNNTPAVKNLLVKKNLVVTWSDDTTLCLWDAITGKFKRTFQGHFGSIQGALIHEDKLISWSQDKMIRLWDIVSGKELKFLYGHSTSITGATLHKNTLISWSYNEILSWNVFIGDKYKPFKSYATGINNVIAQNSILINWSTLSKTLRSLDFMSGEVKKVFTGHSSYVRGALLYDNSLISWDENELLSWDVYSGSAKNVFKGHSKSIKDVLVHGNTLFGWTNDHAFFSWDINSGKTDQIFQGHSAPVFKVLIKGDLLVSISSNELIIWNYFDATIREHVSGGDFTNFQIHENFLYITDSLNTLRIYHFPDVDSVCRVNVDAKITTLQVVEGLNRIILVDSSGKLHFYAPVGFEV